MGYKEEAIECVKDYVLPLHKQIYAKYNGDYDRIFSQGYNSRSYQGSDAKGSVPCVTYIKLLLSLKHIIFQQNNYYIKNKATQLHFLPTLIM